MTPITPNVGTLILTKFFIPRLADSTIQRPHLTKLLNQASRHKLTLVAAPAGYGKTTLVSAWLAGLPQDTCVGWVSLDADDSEPLRFWQYLVSALDKVTDPGCPGALAALKVSPEVAIDYVVGEFINDVAQLPSTCLLVLDDYHTIAEPTIDRWLAYLLEHLPPNLHLMLLSRTTPSLPLSRLRSQEQLLELDAKALACSLEEVGHYFRQSSDLSLDDSELQAIFQRTEGWFAGLQLVRISYRGAEGQQASRSIDEQYILDYLIDDVLIHQPEVLQHFLMVSSAFNRFSAELCDFALERTDSGALIAQIEKLNLFLISLDQQRQWFRYHALFAETLQTHLGRSPSGRTKEQLYQRASQWFEQHGLFDEALSYALQGRDLSHAAALLERGIISSWQRGRDLLRIIEQVSQAPRETLMNYPVLCHTCAVLLQADGQIHLIEPWLDLVEEGLQKAPMSRPAMLENARGLRVMSAAFQGDAQRARQLAAALDGIEAQTPYFPFLMTSGLAFADMVEGEVMSAYARYQSLISIQSPLREVIEGRIGLIAHSGILLNILGRLRESYQQIDDLIAVSVAVQGPPFAQLNYAYLNKADILREYGDLDAALDLILSVIDHVEQYGTSIFIDDAYRGLLRIYLSRGEYAAAAAVTEQVTRLDPNYASPYRQILYLVDRVRVWLLSGQAVLAVNWMGRTLARSPHPSAYLREREAVAFARIHLYQGAPEKAAELLASYLPNAEGAGRQRDVIEMLMLQALALAQIDDSPNEAFALIERALQLADQCGFVRLLADEGAPMRDLLTSYVRTKARPSPYAQVILDALPAAPRKPGRSSLAEQQLLLIEPLTERELEVIQLIAAGASNQEIADQLVIAVNTVKRHVHNAFSKLGVGSRTQLLVKARILGLIADPVEMLPS